MFKKKKQEIPSLIGACKLDCTSGVLADRLRKILKDPDYYPSNQKLWEELWKHWDRVRIEADNFSVRIYCDISVNPQSYRGYDNVIKAIAPNLPDALALALLQTIGQRKTDKANNK